GDFLDSRRAGCKLACSFFTLGDKGGTGNFEGADMRRYIPAWLVLMALLLASAASGGTFTFSTGDPDGLIATASRPPSTGKIETETADDFVITQQTTLNTASFTGLITGGGTTADVGRVTVDIYRVFP